MRCTFLESSVENFQIALKYDDVCVYVLGLLHELKPSNFQSAEQIFLLKKFSFEFFASTTGIQELNFGAILGTEKNQ